MENFQNHQGSMNKDNLQKPGRIDLNNYMPDPSKATELKRRLYDSGISNIPMPSVKRPIEQNISNNPYSAKMNPSKIQNTSELKKGIEKLNKNIINNLKQSYEIAAVQEAKYKGEGTAEYYKSQHIMVPPPVGSKRLMPRMQVTEDGPQITGMSSTNRILLNKGPKPNQLPSLSDYGRERMNQLGQSQMDNMRLLQGPPAMVMAGFEGGYSLGQKNLELARSKYLVDKLTGKLSEELRAGKLPPLDAHESTHPSQGAAKEESKEEGDDAAKPKEAGQQKWSDLDKYIELLLDSKSEEETVFVYLLPNPNGNPYDLLVTPYGETREGNQQAKEKYYTLSGKGLTLYENDMPVEFLSLGQWLIERDSFNHISELDFFKKFKKWKFMRMWKKTIKKQARMKAQNSLEEKLFMLQDHFSEHLFAHKRFMIDMEKQRFIDPCNTTGDTKQIKEFTDCQEKKIKNTQDEITKFSDRSRENIRECITEVLQELRARIVSEIALTEERKKNDPVRSSGSVSMKRKAASNKYEKLGFPEGMTYGHRSSLRKECSRFLRFAYLVDFISLEALANIYTGSVHAMICRIKELDDNCDMDEVLNADYDASNQAAGGVRGTGGEPLFFVSVELNEDAEIPDDQVVSTKIDYFNQKTDPVESFDLLAHLELEEEAGEAEDDDDEEEGGAAVLEPIYRKGIPTIEKYWLRMEPSCDDYIDCLIKTFSMGLEHIKTFERWSKHNDLTPYAEVLEEWDEKVGDSWDEPDSPKLDPKTWIQENPIYTNQKEDVKTILEKSFNKMDEFLRRFQPILEIYWRNKQLDLQILIHERLANPIDSLSNTIKLFNHYKALFSSKIPETVDIGLIQLDSNSARVKIQPTPDMYLQEIKKFIPIAIREQNDKRKKWLKERIRELSRPIQSVEDFVEQDAFYKYTEASFQNVRDHVDMLGQTYNVFAEHNMDVPKKDDKDSYIECMQYIAQLSNIKEGVESSQEGHKETFKKTLSKDIPAHEKVVNKLYEDMQSDDFLEISDVIVIRKRIADLQARFDEADAKAERFGQWQLVLDQVPHNFENQEMARSHLGIIDTLWRSFDEWTEKQEEWNRTPFKDVDAQGIAKQADMYFRNCNKAEKHFDEQTGPVIEKLKAMVVQFKEAMPIVTALRNDKLEPNHWAEIKTLISKDFETENPEFTLKTLIDMDVNQFAEEIAVISTQATQEHNLRGQVAKIADCWRSTAFNTKLDEKTDVKILSDMDDVFTALDDTLAEINMILGSRFVKPLRALAEGWKKDIIYMSEMVDEWLKCQKTWRYLQNIFKGEDIKRTLPEEAKRFEEVDKFFKQLMATTDKSGGNVKKVSEGKGGKKQDVKAKLEENNEKLDKIQKRLDDYMETKRRAFPRFYFLSSDELIDILANSRNMDIIQGHLKTCFDNIVRLEVDEEELQGMYSNEKEYVKFFKPRSSGRGGIEKWLCEVQEEMIATLRKLMKEANKEYAGMDRKKFVMERKGQIVATVAQIQWCATTEQALNELINDPFAMQQWLDINIQQLEQLTGLVRGDLTDLQRKVIVALVTTDVHARDIVDEMMQEKVQNTLDFRWVKQLRYYWDEEDPKLAQGGDCVVRQVAATLNYAYEYMGATSRLVITPLTDRCWITISNALHIKLGANPAGPAGTGKTESTKDLAKALAIQCIVFNCSDQVDYQMMGRLFSGLCQQGCWTCLDEFNRINVEVLSVIAQQLLSIRKGLLAELSEFVFEEQQVKLKVTFGCHVTMNPGYAGRTELPDNLKVLFRPVAMMIPDYGLIAEIMLFAEGFGNAKILSKKMVQLYKLSSEQLSQQDHYDFGLRAVKSVLVMAGSLKRANPELIEDGVLIRAMRDANIPKFLRDDVPLFNAIIQDLFPSIEITENDYGKLKVTIEEMISSKNLQLHPSFIIKVIQLYETFNVRFGVMLVGNTGGGKSKTYEILRETFNTMRERGDPNEAFQYVNLTILNPKSISMGEMYGEVNESTQEWTDGLASQIMRNASKETGEDRTWVVFDGPVDALWIESMNTVLDDNMTLCLANGQRIKLRSQMRMLFEVQDLAVASPATVSRCGMVYMTAEDIGWHPMLDTWLQTYFVDKEELMDEVLVEHLKVTLYNSLAPGLEWIREFGDEPIKTTDLQQVQSVLHFVEAFIDAAKGFKGKEEERKKHIDAICCYSYTWGLGGALTQKSKEKFDAVIREQYKVAQVPLAGTCFDYYYEMKREKVFKPWAGQVKEFKYDKDCSFFDLVVPTVDTTKYAFLLETLMALQYPMFFTGNTGVGKSAMIQSTLQALKEKDTVLPIFINMSAQTTSGRTQQSIEEKLEKKGRAAIGPPVGKKLAVFVDDINMPQVEGYGAQPPIELLRLFIDKKGLYERAEWQWKDILDFNLIACAAPPSGGRATISMRLTRRLNLFCLPEASPGTLTTIFASILKGFLAGGFQDKVRNLQDAAIASTIEIYTRIQVELRATPTKFHYAFNLRDVSKVVQGLCMVKPQSVPNEEIFYKLWLNESFRVFYDRLINEDDRDWFGTLCLELLVKNFKQNPDREDLYVNNRVMFGDLLKLDSPTQFYENITDKKKLLKILHNSLEDYNAEGASSKMNLVLFDDALEHILRIGRVLKQPRGHIMLIGVGGSGKQSLIRLVSYMRGIEYESIEITKKFGTAEFKEVVKGYMKRAGIEGTGISFVMTDTQIIDEAFIENLNNLLNTGEIPNLMLPEDVEEINNGVRPVCQQKKIVDSIDNIQALFTARVRENLHICLCMSPVGDTLRVRCRQFPSLINCCTLDWFSRWPEEALLYVSRAFLKELPDVSEAVRAGLGDMCCQIHLSVEQASAEFFESLRRRVYTTPKSYLDLISLYLKVLEQYRDEYQTNKMRLANGLNKLNSTNANIAELREKLTVMQPILEQKNIDLAAALIVVNRDKAVADEQERVVSAEAAIVDKTAADAKAIADEAEGVLAAAKPELEGAQKALQSLDKAMIVEIKNFTAPPQGVQTVMECVMVLLGEGKAWTEIKGVLKDVNAFIERLKTYDVAATKDAVWKRARDKYISKPAFEPAEVRRVSVAAAALCVWCRSCSGYALVTKKVAPMKIRHAAALAELNAAQAELKVKLDQVQTVTDRVAKLEADCQQMQDEKEALESTMETSKARMGRAEKLVVLLADEGVRWKDSVEKIADEISKLVGNVFISCACISYFGAFTGEYREKLVRLWVEGCTERGIPCSEDCSLPAVMGDAVLLRTWNINGLPNDAVSSENGILCTRAERYSLCIDPQQQANKWIKNMEKDNKLVLLKLTTPNFLRSVSAAVRIGQPCLVEDIEEALDPALDPLLLHQEYKTEGGLYQIRLGDQVIDYDQLFKFFVTTKMPNPHYIPEICIKVTLINFTVTYDGLKQQMLGDVVVSEKPAVEEKRSQIVLTMAADAKKLKELENGILKLLSEATLEQILDEDTLIETLETSKVIATEINERMAQSKIVELEINETRNVYLGVAVRGSVLYFVIADLAKIDPMYQNSLQYVKALFNQAIAASEKSEDIETRLASLIDNITKTIFTNVSRGLFEKDKVVYSFLICTSILRNAGAIDEAIWNIFLRGPTVFSAAEKAAALDSPDLLVCNKLSWDTVRSAELRSKGQFEGLTADICEKWESEWKEWAQGDNPAAAKLPGDWSEKLDAFDKLILVRAFRLEQVTLALTDYVVRAQGRFYVEAVSSAMDIVFPQLNVYTPMIFVLTQGSDPTAILLSFAAAMNFADKLHPISLGQGQGEKAAKLIKASCAAGDWVMLQNCHLAESWMNELEKIVLAFAEGADTIHPDFRLFLTSMPAPYFPVSVLQNSVKVTTEPPKGLKANLKRTYTAMNQEFLDKCSKPEVWRKLLFCLSFNHAILQERRKFGPLGFNIRYEFNDSDLHTTFTMLQLFLDTQDEVAWDALTFVTGHINYGGRVTDDNDRICLLRTLHKYCNPEAIRDGYMFSQSGIYYAPKDGSYQSYMDYIETFPLNDHPEVFGLHTNANINSMETDSLNNVNTILEIQPRLIGGGGGLTPDEVVIQKSAGLLERLPELLDPRDALEGLFAKNELGLIPSLSTVLAQEMEKFNRLLSVMKRSLVDIELAIKGFIVMSETLDSMYLKIQNNQVPLNWSKVAYPSLKPLASWYGDMIRRLAFMDAWIREGNPASYWLPGMIFPQGFMTGVLQTHARKHKIAIDRLAFTFQYLPEEGHEEIEEAPEDGVYIYGLYMDGARWDRENQIITDQFPTIMFDKLPCLHFTPKEDHKLDPDEYQAPLYKTSVRAGVLSTTGLSTNFVVHVSTPSKEAPGFWTQRAAALLTMLND